MTSHRPRPKVFDREALEASLRKQGCAESFVGPTISDYRLFVPLLFHELGVDGVFALVEAARPALGLGDQQPAWRQAITYLVTWADEEIARYSEAG